MPDRHVRRADDGEPLVRPLPRLAARRRRPPGGPELHRRERARRSTTQRLTPDWQGCGHPDPDHSWEGGRTQLNGGRCDGFLRSGDNDVFSISYYAEGDLGFIQDAAKAFTTFDRFHCSLMGSTLPNREYMHAAQSYGMIDNDLPPQTEHRPASPTTRSSPRSTKAGVSNRYFFNDVPVSALWGAPGLARSGPIAEYYARCASRHAAARLASSTRTSPAAVGEGPGLSRRRAPARRRAHRPGVHGRRRATRSWSRRSGSAARCSSSTTSGAASSTTSRPPRVPDQRNDARHQQGLRADGLPDPGGRRVAVRASAATSRTRSTASSRS